jgi:chromosome segregation protein
MGDFASFRKCDFQIHSPRDPGWRGIRPVGLKDSKPGGGLATSQEVDNERRLPFEKASEGQRATVLLMMLLKQGGGPIIIDQPEGDLDNSVITKVVDLLHDIKHMRQLIFASHNANLVVNGSAEMVAIMNNDSAGHRVVEASGAIDQPEVRIAITGNMEGGKEAFKDRQRKYGF